MIPKRDYEIVYQETNDEGRFVVICFYLPSSIEAQLPEQLFVLLTYPITLVNVFHDVILKVPAKEYDDVYPIYKSYGDNVIRVAIGMIDQIKRDKKYSSRL